jgi:hypothetical protein
MTRRVESRSFKIRGGWQVSHAQCCNRPTRASRWVAAASRGIWLPSVSVAPRTVLPSTAIATSAGDAPSGPRAVSRGRRPAQPGADDRVHLCGARHR